MGAICNIIFAWFPTNERTQALAIGYMMFPLTGVLKYTFFTRKIDSETSAEIAHGITLFEIFEANLFTLFGVLAIFMMKDKPKNPPSFLATQKELALQAQLPSLKHINFLILVFAFASCQSAIMASLFENKRNEEFAAGLFIGTLYSIKFAKDIDAT